MADKFDEELRVILGRLNAHIEAIEGKTIGGLLAAGFMIERESNKNVPIEYGNLRGSSFTRRAQDDEDAVEVGYGASYAVYVHENMEMKLAGKPRPSGLGNYWGPHGGPKFLERAVIKLESIILETVAKFAKVK